MTTPTAHAPSSHATRQELPRVLGFTSVVGILVGTVIGSGIFVAPNRIASLVESPQLIMAVWIVGGVLSFFGALASPSWARRIRRRGACTSTSARATGG